jgi:hypothetical protein
MITYAEQFAILLSTHPSDDDFIKKVQQPRADLDKAFQTELMSLSQAVLTLLGFLPGDWLDQIDSDAFFKLQHEREIYQSAKESIRARKLEAYLEGMIYYIRPMDLVSWFLKKNIWIHPVVVDFLNLKIGPKRRGRKRSCPEIVEQAGEYFIKIGQEHVTATDLKESNDPHIQILLQRFINFSKSKPGRRIKKLAENVNVYLQDNLNRIT